jgi:hypothetical protein
MSSFYLYCIRNYSTHKSHELGAGIKAIGKGPVSTLLYKDIEAIISQVDLIEFSSPIIANKAREDIPWIIANSKIHERVVECAMGARLGARLNSINTASKTHNIVSVIPMKFGTIFKNKENLMAVLKKDYKKFKDLLARLEKKQEWGVKVYVRERSLREGLKSSENALQTLLRDASNLRTGADYFKQLEIDKETDSIMQTMIDKLALKFYKLLNAHAVDSCRSKILTREFSRHKEPMVMNTQFFIHQDKVLEFVSEVTSLQTANPEFVFEYTGPWPAYNFI